MEKNEAEESLATSRIQALSDGIFAFAMTLLILDVRVPKILPDLVHEQLGHKLFILWPKTLSYVTSFMILGVGWVGHHTVFHYVKRSNRIFLWINILYLMGVAFVPFTTSLLGAYGKEQLVILVFGTNLFLIASLLYGIWWYATYRHRLVDSHLDPIVITLFKQRIAGAILAYFIVIGISFVSTSVGRILFLIIPLSYIRPSRLDRYFK